MHKMRKYGLNLFVVFVIIFTIFVLSCNAVDDFLRCISHQFYKHSQTDSQV
jgi:hypothetical protein